MVPTTLVLRSLVRDIGKELPRVEPVLFVLFWDERSQSSTGNLPSMHMFQGYLQGQPLCRRALHICTIKCTVCVCVFFPFILDIKFVGRTSRGHTGGRSHRISHPPSFCGACLNFSREKDSAIPFPRRP